MQCRTIACVIIRFAEINATSAGLKHESSSGTSPTNRLLHIANEGGEQVLALDSTSLFNDSPHLQHIITDLPLSTYVSFERMYSRSIG